MAKAFVVIKNGNRVVDRAGSKGEAKDSATALLLKHPGASFEIGKLDKRLWATVSVPQIIYDEEDY